jgi:hypothetical protein
MLEDTLHKPAFSPFFLNFYTNSNSTDKHTAKAKVELRSAGISKAA